MRALLLGRDGEKIVGQQLEELREKGYKVLHDIVGEGFNIDHVIISPNGVFAIETKTFSKPTDKNATILFDGKILKIDKIQTDNPLVQAKAASSWLRDLLLKSTGKPFQVKPVVVFPGWYVESKGPEAHKEIWVLNPKSLPSFIANEKKGIAQEDVQLITFHLSQYVRMHI